MRPSCDISRGLGLITLAMVLFLGIVTPLAAAGPEERILDVAMQMPSGVLIGQVAPTKGTRPDKTVAGLQVLLLENGRPAAETRTDREGRFRVENLSGGVYLVVVHGAQGPTSLLCRAWAPETAPPNAATICSVRLRQAVVRGQAFPALTFPQAAAYGGIVAGAVAAPVLYHNTRLNNGFPAAPASP